MVERAEAYVYTRRDERYLFAHGQTSKPSSKCFYVHLYLAEYKKMCEWTLMKKNTETGGDLFGLWYDSYNPVVQLVLGPGKRVRRTAHSFFQDVGYLEEVGSHLTQNEGLCHIGEWHSHHQLGLERPSWGDENTVWQNMPRYDLKHFIVFIANVRKNNAGVYVAKVECFLFETDDFSVKRGEFIFMKDETPLRVHSPTLTNKIKNGSEQSQVIEVTQCKENDVWFIENYKRENEAQTHPSPSANSSSKKKRKRKSNKRNKVLKDEEEEIVYQEGMTESLDRNGMDGKNQEKLGKEERAEDGTNSIQEIDVEEEQKGDETNQDEEEQKGDETNQNGEG